MDEIADWGSFLSGLAALLAIIIAVIQIRKNTKNNEANFWLNLRELFKSSDRDFVHRSLREGTWQNNIPTTKEWIKIEDYMGLLEVCEGMLDKEIINAKVFRNLYEYRIYNILKHKVIVDEKLIFECYDWTTFYKLLIRLDGQKWKKMHHFLSEQKFGINEIQSMDALKSKLGEEKCQYFTHLYNSLKLDYTI